MAVIQQRYDKTEKTTKWGEIDPWLIDELYLNERFKQFFDERAGYCTDGLYPYSHNETNNVGFKNETTKKRTLGNLF